MLKFIFRKIASKKWMFLALLIGNILLSAIACSNPLYSDAVMQRMLDDDLENYITEKNAYPGNIILTFSGSAKRNGILAEVEQYAMQLPEMYGVEAIHTVSYYNLPQAQTEAEVQRKDTNSKSAVLASLTDLSAHAKITAGRMYSDTLREDGTVEVIVSQRALMDLNLLLNERRTFPKIMGTNGKPVTVEVVGVYDIADTADTYWVKTPSNYKLEMFMAENLFRELFVYENTPVVLNATWFQVLDAEKMLSRRADEMWAANESISEYDDTYSYISVHTAFETLLQNHISMKLKVSVTLWVLQVPIYVLLIAFIFMVSRQILDTEASEIAVLKSRGVKNRQIVGIYFLQSFMISVAAVAAGIPLGVFLTQVLGSANAFLEFISRRSLPVTVTPVTALYAVAAALIAIIAMVFPVRKYTRGSIVTQKQKKNRKAKPFWQKTFLDVIALGVSIYGLYSFNSQKAMLAQKILAGEVPDPLLLLCSSLFIIGAGLLAIRIIPFLITIVFFLFKRLWSPAMYAFPAAGSPAQG